jgi:hypothetical protein
MIRIYNTFSGIVHQSKQMTAALVGDIGPGSAFAAMCFPVYAAVIPDTAAAAKRRMYRIVLHQLTQALELDVTLRRGADFRGCGTAHKAKSPESKKREIQQKNEPEQQNTVQNQVITAGHAQNFMLEPGKHDCVVNPKISFRIIASC